MDRSQNRRFHQLLPLALMLLFGVISCGDDDVTGSRDQLAEEPFSFALDGSGAVRLQVEAINGTVTITGVPGADSVFIDGEKEVRSTTTEDAEAGLELIEVTAEIVGQEAQVTTTHPVNTQGRDDGVDYEISIPADWEVVVTQANGIVTIESVNNDVSANQANGNVLLDGIAGETFIGVGNGEIEGTVTLPSGGTIEWSIGNGLIDLRIPTTTSAEFSATVGNGSISTSNLQFQNESSTATSFSGTLGSGNGEITLSAGNGTISATGF